MEQRGNRETRIGAGLVIGLVAFVSIALVSFYFQKPAPHLSTGIQHNIATTTR